MAGCDGWITIKILELIFATFCLVYKRVTDDEASKLFYFLQKFSREWPLLNNVTWEENGAIFTDVTYGGYIIIIIGLIIGQCTGELQKCRKTENFFLILGALLFIAAGSLELAALESVEERLVDNAAILGVFSLLTGFLFIIDLLCSSKRRKKEKLKIIEKYMQSKPTQTEENKSFEMIKGNYEHFQNGNTHTHLANGNRIPKNGVKLLPSSPVISNGTPVVNANDYTGTAWYSDEPPVIDGSEIKTHQGKIKSTESFLRSEKGYYPKFRKPSEQDRSNNNFFIPDGYVLVPANHLQDQSKPKSDSGIGESPTPPVYTKIISSNKVKPGYVVIPIEQKETSRKQQSASVDSPEFYYLERPEGKSRSPKISRSTSVMNSSDYSDVDEPKISGHYKRDTRSPYFKKVPLEYLDVDFKGRKYILQSEDSSDEQKFSYPSEFHFRPESRHSSRSLKGSKEWHHYSKGKVNDAYTGDKENDLAFVSSRRSSPFRSRASSPEKPKSILRYDYGRSSKKENGLYLPKNGRYDSLDSHKIAEDLKNLREITKSDLDITENLEKENKMLKERLREEKIEKEKLKYKLEDKKKLEDSDEEKNRRVSEREEQYFGIKDLSKSYKDRLETTPKIKNLVREGKKTGKGVEEVNEKLKQKAAREEQEFRDLIDERFYFLHEEEKKRKDATSPTREPTEKFRISEKPSTPDLTGHSKSTKPQKSYSDELNSSQSTDDEIKIRVGTPGSTSYKSEAMFWLGNKEPQDKSNTPTSPGSPGYVLYTAQNWPDSPSPEDRFQFSAKEAQHISLGTPPKTPILDRDKPDFSISDEKKNSQKLRLLEFEEVPENVEKSQNFRKGLLLRKVDFPKEPVIEIKRPAVVQGSTSTWKKWLYPKPKLQHTRSVPN